MPDKETPDVSFGEELKRSRVIREVSLESIAAATKISVRHLEALEKGDVAKLPAPVFTRGFIRAYAGFLGLDPEEMVNAYLAEVGAGAARGSFAPGPSGRGPSTRLVVLGIVAAAIAILVGAGVWRNSRRSRPAAPRAATLPPVSLSPRIRQVAPATESVPPAPNSTVPPATTAAPPPPAVPSPKALPPGTPLSEAESNAALTLVLDARGDCWTEVAGDGRAALFSGTLHRGDARTFTGQKSFRLTVGNAGLVRVSVNGRDLPLLGKPGQVARDVRLDAARVNEILSPRG